MPEDHQNKNPQSVSTRLQNDGRGRPPPVIMLVMGLRGCGKSTFINSAVGQNECVTSTGSKLCTKFPRTCKISKYIGDCEFKFIDTPGFGDEIIADRKVFERLVEYLAPNPGVRSDGPNLPRRATGLLYIHSEDESFKSRASQKTIEMLVKIMGEQFIDRVTVLVKSQNKAQIDLARVTQSKDSPLHPLYCYDNKPWATIPYPQDPQSIEGVLEPYTPVHPRLVRFAAMENFAQRDGKNWQYNDISRHLRDFFPEDVGPPITLDQGGLQTRLQEREEELGKTRDSLAQKEEEIKNLQSAHENELRDIHEKKKVENSDHDLQRKILCKTIRDYEEEIPKLKLEKESEHKELEALKEEMNKLKLEKESEIEALQTQLQAKDEGINRFKLEKEAEIKALQDGLEAKDEELVKLKSISERRVQDSMDAIRAKESEIMELKNSVNGTLNKNGNKREGEISRLEEEIRRIKAEYGSLRNHMQLEENTEQADITTILGDINRLIEEFGQTLSEHIEKHMEENSSGKNVRPQDLLSLFGPIGGELASKDKQDAYVLFEYAVQATICNRLCTHLFEPFHPSIADDEKRNAFILRLYEQMTYQEAQAVAGRWRKDAFNSISRDPKLGLQDKSDDKRMHRIITEALSALLGKVVEIQPQEILNEHDRALVKIINKAEELNRLLKGGVSILGDFQPKVFPFGEAFRSDYMSEVSSKPKKGKHPETILATVELGIMKRYALGGNRKPEETILRKAVVFGLPK